MTATQGVIVDSDSLRLVKSLRLAKREAMSEIQLLLGFAQSISRASVVAFPERLVELDNFGKYHTLLQRRLEGEPIAYIFGQKEFYGIDFSVDSSVLIPRPETELLVERALERIPKDVEIRILDLGTGSGNIALTLARQRPSSRVTAIDNSTAALETAIRNAQHLNSKNVTFLQSDWFDAIPKEVFNVIVANPPYVANGDPHLQSGDVRFEPKSALLGGRDGIEELHQIVMDSPDHLVRGGWLLIEHGYNQANLSQIELVQAGFAKITTHTDLGGNPRITEGQI